MSRDPKDSTDPSQHSLESSQLFDLSVDMMCVAGTEGYFLRVNPAFEKTLGWTTLELLSKPFFEFVHPDDRDGTTKALETLVHGDEIIDFENRYLHRDGTFRWFQWRAVPTEDVIYAVARDVTEAKEQAERRRRLEERMRQAQKLESLGLLAGGIAHDFNNLLSGILGHTELARRKLPAGSPARDDLELVETTALRASELCNQMLAYSGKGRFLSQRFRLAELVSEMVQLIEVSISKKVRLAFDLADDAGRVEGDISQIRQVVLNLITNASEAIGDRAGEIVVSTGVVEASASYLADSPMGGPLDPGSYAFFEISDDGQGMDAETQARIFDPFFTTKFAGRGLGLAAVLGIIRGHGGAIRVESEAGRGTRFRILLPRVDEPVAEAARSQEPVPYRGHGTVLVADDDPRVRSVSEQFLEALGFEVLVAVDGVECLELFERQGDSVRLVILDHTMPRLDGVATLHRLRALRADLPVLMTSGYSQQAVEVPEEGGGPLSFLQKPFRLGDLEERLREVLPDTAAG